MSLPVTRHHADARKACKAKGGFNGCDEDIVDASDAGHAALRAATPPNTYEAAAARPTESKAAVRAGFSAAATAAAAAAATAAAAAAATKYDASNGSGHAPAQAHKEGPARLRATATGGATRPSIPAGSTAGPSVIVGARAEAAGRRLDTSVDLEPHGDHGV